MIISLTLTLPELEALRDHLNNTCTDPHLASIHAKLIALEKRLAIRRESWEKFGGRD